MKRLSFALVALAVCAAAPPLLPPPPPYPGETAVVVQRGAALQALPLVATLTAAQLQPVRSPAGRVAAVAATVGENVVAGTILATLHGGNTLVAPVAGTLVWIQIAPAARLQAGEIVAQIGRGSIVLRATVPKALRWELQTAAPMSVVVPALGPLPLPVTVVGSAAEGAVTLRFVGSAPSGALPGMGAVVEAPAAMRPGRPLVPVSALHIAAGNAPYVWRVDGVRLSRVAVRVAWRRGVSVAVASGLQVGQRVLVRSG